MRWWIAITVCGVTSACGPAPSPSRDAGRDGARACSPAVITDYRSGDTPGRLPRCTDETLRCAAACGDDVACVARCLQADTTPAFTGSGTVVSCASCVSNQQIACVANRGCGATFSAAQCCPTERGLSPSDREGIEAECGPTIRAFESCRSANAPRCYAITEPEVMACFGAAGDAGVPTDAAADR